MKARRRRNFLTEFVTVAHQKLMKSSTTLKYRSDENPPQAKFFNRICHSRTQINNEILNEIEMQKLRKPIVGEIFYNICHSRTQIINEILNEIKYKSDERPTEVKFFNSICQGRTQIINGIENEIEV